jgi:hypothetical protein
MIATPSAFTGFYVVLERAVSGSFDDRVDRIGRERRTTEVGVDDNSGRIDHFSKA